jgi:aminopeptidase N
MEKNFPRAPTTMIAPPSPGAPPRPEIEPIVHIPVTPSPARNVQAVAERGARAVEFFAQRFGPYPYGSLELTQMPGRISQGWPGLVFLSSFAFLTPAQAQDLTSFSLDAVLNSLILPHETAHQWWGDLVGWRTYRDQWLVEALANYSALMMMESEKSGDARKVLEKYRSELLVKNKDEESLSEAGPVSLGLRLSSSHFPGGYEAISYGRGTWLFHMLRHMLLDAESRQPNEARRSGNDELFIRALRKVRDRYEGKAITTRELFEVFEEDLPKPLWYEGHKSLDWFVHSWVEGTAIPRLSAQKVKFTKKPSGGEVTGIIVQEDAPKDLVSAIPVYAMTVDKPVWLGMVMADGPETRFHFSVPRDTRKIVLDPYETMLTAPK